MLGFVFPVQGSVVENTRFSTFAFFDKAPNPVLDKKRREKKKREDERRREKKTIRNRLPRRAVYFTATRPHTPRSGTAFYGF